MSDNGQNRDYLNEFMDDLKIFKENIGKFDNKELSVAEYKGFSGGYGSYAQRGGEKHMLRLRMPGGRLTKQRLKFIADTCDKYGVDLLKLTTCQCIQMHNLSAKDVPEIMEKAWYETMITRGGGGDFARNVMASPLSGTDKDETFDVIPYAEAASRFAMQFVKTVKFPRKLKIAFSNTKENVPHATIRDMGFVAREDGKFDVYAAGGMGNNPAIGLKVGEAVEPEKFCYYIQAMVNTFVENGNYTNRGRARTRYMQLDMGREEFLAAYAKNLEKVISEEKLDVKVEKIVIDKAGNGSLDVEAYSNVNPNKPEVVFNRVAEQKQDGLYSVFYQPIGGILLPEKARKLYELIKDMEQVEIRITPTEGMYIINLNADEAKKVLAATEDGASNIFETSVACIGSGICQVGLGDSQSMLKLCVDEVRKENFANGVLPKLYFSGCPSSCSGHHIAEIGFRGAMKQTADGPKPAFAIFLGGEDEQGREKFAELGKSIAREDIPKLLVELGRAVSAENTVYSDWIKTNKEKMNEIVEKYS